MSPSLPAPTRGAEEGGAGGEDQNEAARGRRVLLVLALALAAVLVDLGRFHLHEHSDSIVPVLVSLQRWTPFYWDQERYGMLVPLLAVPVRDPLLNLLLQRGLLVFAGLAAVVLLARHALSDRDWPLAGALAAGLLLLLAPDAWAFEYLGDQPYGLSLALALAGLALAEPRPRAPAPFTRSAGRDSARGRGTRVATGLLLVLAAHWVNAAIGFLALALAAVRAVADALEGDVGLAPVRGLRPGSGAGPRGLRAIRERLRTDALLLAAGLAASWLWLQVYPTVTGKPLRLATGLLPPAEWPRAWVAFLGNGWREGMGWFVALAFLAALGAAALLLSPALRPVAPGAFLRAGALAAAAVAYALFVGGLRWVADNGFAARYLAPSAVLLHVAAVSLVAEPLARLRRGAARLAFVAAVAAVPAAALFAWGSPSLATVRADLEGTLGRHASDVRAAGCQLVSGDYWSVWPTVFETLRAAHDGGEPAASWGICHRSNPTVPQWSGIPRERLRICVPAGEEEAAERWLRAFHLWPSPVLDREGTVLVLVRTPER
jgi:hypothetical protein